MSAVDERHPRSVDREAPAATDRPLPLSELLRSATRERHGHAESMPFVEDLMAGRLGVAAYTDLLVQHHAIYSAIESAEEYVQADEAGRTVHFPALRRVPSIEADLALLAGPDWQAFAIRPATQAYVERLHEVVAERWVGGYAAHAYTRYLGDLSGGQAIRATLQRTYGVPAECLTFYSFPSIPKVKPFKDLYRSRLDALPLTEADRARTAAEACVAFDHNAAVFADLGADHQAG